MAAPIRFRISHQRGRRMSNRVERRPRRLARRHHTITPRRSHRLRTRRDRRPDTQQLPRHHHRIAVRQPHPRINLDQRRPPRKRPKRHLWQRHPRRQQRPQILGHLTTGRLQHLERTIPPAIGEPSNPTTTNELHRFRNRRARRRHLKFRSQPPRTIRPLRSHRQPPIRHRQIEPIRPCRSRRRSRRRF